MFALDPSSLQSEGSGGMSSDTEIHLDKAGKCLQNEHRKKETTTKKT